MENFYYLGKWRFDLGLGNSTTGLSNPNNTATLLISLVFAAFAVIHLWRHGFWLFLPVFVAGNLLLLHTYSRGGLLSELMCLPLLCYAVAPKISLPQKLVFLGVLAILVIYAVHIKATNRYVKGIIKEDRSVGNRLIIFKAVPKMLCDAPEGWGDDSSAQAYQAWYQPVDRNEKYVNLVSSHATWMVEAGWPLRFAYLFLWFYVLAIFGPSAAEPWKSVPFSIWAAFFIGATFNPVAHCIYNWIIPALSLLLPICFAWKKTNLRNIRSLIFALVFTLMAISTLICLGALSPRDLIIKKAKFLVHLGHGKPEMIIIDVENSAEKYGHAIRKGLANKSFKSSQGKPISSLVFSHMPHLSLKEVDTVVFLGLKNPFKLGQKISRLVIFNPTCSAVGNDFSSKEVGELVVVFGEFFNPPVKEEWRRFMQERNGKYLEVEGIDNFFPELHKFF